MTEEDKKPEKPEEKKEEKVEGKKEEKKKDAKKEVKPKKKKTGAVAKSHNLPISTKYATAICKFIKNKQTGDAIRELEEVLRQKKAIPMKGEIPHRKGIMSGRYPKKATQHFIKLIKSLASNANMNELENPVIVEAIANMGSRPYGRFGSIKRKRTHIKIKVKEKKAKK